MPISMSTAVAPVPKIPPSTARRITAAAVSDTSPVSSPVLVIVRGHRCGLRQAPCTETSGPRLYTGWQWGGSPAGPPPGGGGV